MARYRNSRIIPIIFIVVISVIAVAAMVALARAVFFSAPSTNTAVVDAGRAALLSIEPDNSVQMTVRGPIVADEAFQSYQITISPNARTLTTYSGYLSQGIDRIELGNNTEAYEQFVYALDKANLSQGEPFEDDDTRGICASGRVTEFEIINAGEVVERLWTSTCRGSTGSLDASVTQLSKLFVNQIPDGQSLINKIDV